MHGGRRGLVRVEGEGRDSADRGQADGRKAVGFTGLLVTVEREGMVSALCGAALRSKETHRFDSKQIDRSLPRFFIVSISIEREYTVCHASRSRLVVNEGGGPHSQHVERRLMALFVLAETAIAIEGKQVVQDAHVVAVVAIPGHGVNPQKTESPVSLGSRSGIIPEGEQSIGDLGWSREMTIQKHGVELGLVLRTIVPVSIERKQAMLEKRWTRFLPIQ